MTTAVQSIQPDSKSPSRRALLAGALGGLGAIVASAIGRPAPARAGVDGDVVLGAQNTATTTTKITNSSTGETVLWAASNSGIALSGTSGSDIGVSGGSTSFIAVYGNSSSYIAVYAFSGAANQAASVGRSIGNSTGVQGYSGVDVLPAAKAKTGVFGYAAQDGDSKGVWGESPSGLGVYGKTTTGYAGFFEGKVYTTKWYELTEISTPPSPVANRARLFLNDNGLGKTQLCVKFANGTVKVLATEG